MAGDYWYHILVYNALSDHRNPKGGRTLSLKARPTDTIYSVMEQLEEISGVPPIMQRLYFNGKNLYEDTPGTLADHNIVYDCPMLTAACIISGYNKLVTKTLRAMGFAAVDEDPGDGPLEECRLMEKGGPPLGQPTAGNIRVYLKDHLVPRWGKTSVVEVGAGETVAGFKAQLQRMRGYPPEMQVLCCEGGTMRHDCGKTLADYGVRHGSKLELIMCTRFAVAADVEERRLKKAGISPPTPSPLAPAKSVEESEGVPPVEQQQQLADDVEERKVKKARTSPPTSSQPTPAKSVEESEGVPPVQQQFADDKTTDESEGVQPVQQQQLADDKPAAQE
ncbi:hypothetical protein ACP70R_019582 [Stipagrostis hirtigluma subsp. patula]